MILLSVEKISKSFPDKVLLDKASLYVNDTDKIGIIGQNGTGKTTLLNILAGATLPDEGTVSRASGARIAYLQQNPTFEQDISLLDIVLQHVAAPLRDESAHEAKTMLTKLGFFDYDITTNTMSEGEKKRVAIAQALMSPCELLILDEPTNHLDSHMVQWLESYLSRYKNAIIMVTHDRYFLERVTSRIVEISSGSLYTYEGNYSQFLSLKAQREEIEIATQRKNMSLYRRELEWMQRGARARTTKSKERIDRFHALEDNLGTASNEKLTMGAGSSRLGRQIIEIEDISKSFGDRVIIKDFSHVLLRDARIGIIGRNGCGKSTLIKMIAGALDPDSGSVVRGATVKIGYLSQMWDVPSADTRVIDYIKEEAGELQTSEGTISASKMLERFLFPSHMHWTPVGKLSGGEKRRLFMLRILMGAPNVLLLDEPTNDLDTDTLTVLEAYLDSFNGAVISISHDRYFLDKVVDFIFEFRDGGEIRQYAGGYSDYLEKREPDADEQSQQKESKPKQAVPRTQQKSARFSFSEQREYATIDEDIASLEDQLAQAEQDVERLASDYEQLMPAIKEKERLEAALSDKMERWVYLNELAERIERERTNN